MTNTWHELPDPRSDRCPESGATCAVDLPEHRWSHIQRHVEDQAEPWEDLLSAELAVELRASYRTGMAETDCRTVREKVSLRMEASAKECLQVPLAVVYDVAQERRAGETGSRWALTADLVLRSGAKLCLRERGSGRYAFCTCFFHRCVIGPPRERRWRWLARHLIQRFAKDNGNGTYSPPDSSWGLQYHEETRETVVSPRFRTDRRWGLDPPLSEPWFNIPDPWPAGPPLPPVITLARRPSSY